MGGGGGGGSFEPIDTPPPPPPRVCPCYSSNQEAPTMMHERVQCTVQNDGILEIYIYTVYKGGGGGGFRATRKQCWLRHCTDTSM